MKRLALLVAGSVAFACPLPSAARPGDAFLLTTARDTLAIERFDRTERHVTAALLFRVASARFDFSLEARGRRARARVHE